MHQQPKVTTIKGRLIECAVTAVIPCFPYSRQSSFGGRGIAEPLSQHQLTIQREIMQQTNGYKAWTVRSGKVIASMISEAGADHVITMDLHDPQYQGFFDLPLDNLPSLPLMIKRIKLSIPDWRECVVVTPDAGGSKRHKS